MVLHYFIIFALKHRLWIHFRTASFDYMTTDLVENENCDGSDIQYSKSLRILGSSLVQCMGIKSKNLLVRFCFNGLMVG